MAKFHELSKKAQTAYLKAHPTSKFHKHKKSLREGFARFKAKVANSNKPRVSFNEAKRKRNHAIRLNKQLKRAFR